MLTAKRDKQFTALFWTLAFTVGFQFLAANIPVSLIYNYRMDYEVIKDNLACVGTTLDALEREIRQKGLKEYTILLGDSVMYSGPCSPFQSISAYMNQISAKEGLPLAYNLSIPAGQLGDVYTLLLMLDERDISTDHVVININYAGFIRRDPDPPIVYWLERDLERLDPPAYKSIEGDLARSRENKTRPGTLETFLEYNVYSKIPVLRIRDFIRIFLERRVGARPWEMGDARPWTQKPYLRSLMKGYMYQRAFDPTPMVLDSSNPNVAFLERIAEHQRGKKLIVFMTPVNKDLMNEETARPGFIENMNRINLLLQNMADKYGFTYVDFTDAMNSEEFSDHVHLTAEGYRHLAEKVWAVIQDNRWYKPHQ